MTSLTKIYKKSSNYELNLTGIVPVRGYYETTITGTCFVKGERPAAAPTTKITDEPRLVMRWPKAKGDQAKNQLTLQGFKEVKNPKNYQLTLQGIKEVKNTEIPAPPVFKLDGTKASPTKKAPVLTIVAPLKTTTAVIATEQNAEPAESSSSGDGGEGEEPEPEPEAALVRQLAQLEYDLALSLEEELEESECEQEEIADWAEDQVDTAPDPVFDANEVNQEVQQLFNELVAPVVNKVNSIGDSLINYLPNVTAPTVSITTNVITPRQKFLHAILPELPTGSKYCAANIKEGEIKQTFVASIQEIDEWADKQVALGSDAYFAMAIFGAERRLAKNATSYKCVWLDLDCGSKTDYPSHTEGC